MKIETGKEKDQAKIKNRKRVGKNGKDDEKRIVTLRGQRATSGQTNRAHPRQRRRAGFHRTVDHGLCTDPEATCITGVVVLHMVAWECMAEEETEGVTPGTCMGERLLAGTIPDTEHIARKKRFTVNLQSAEEEISSVFFVCLFCYYVHVQENGFLAVVTYPPCMGIDLYLSCRTRL